MIQSLLLVFSLCLDTFVTSITYGADKIKIPFSSAIIINSICSLFLACAIFLGSTLKIFLSPNLAPILSFILLLILGIYRLFETFSKEYIRKISNLEYPMTFKIFDFKFVLEVYADEAKADYDDSKTLTSKEAFYLAVALSLDSLAVGFGCSLGSINKFDVIILSFIIGLCLLKVGESVGRHFSKIVDVNLSWLSGLILILLAILKII